MADGYDQINSGAAITETFDAGADSFFEKVRQSLVALSFDEQFVGGSRSLLMPDGGGYQEIPNVVPFSVPHARYGGLTVDVIVETRVENAAITLTPKVRRISGTPADIVVGAASASTAGDDPEEAWASQTLSFTAVVGAVYIVMGVRSTDDYEAWMGSAKARRSGL